VSEREKSEGQSYQRGRNVGILGLDDTIARALSQYLQARYLPAGLLAKRPVTGNHPGEAYYATDNHILYAWDGAAWCIVATGGTGVTVHGALTGLLDDDHTQYAKDTDLADYLVKTILTNKGDTIATNASGDPVKVAAGANGMVYTADDAENAGVKWQYPRPVVYIPFGSEREGFYPGEPVP